VYSIGDVVATISVGFDCDANHYTLAGTKGSVHNPVALSGRPEPQKLIVHLHEGNARYEGNARHEEEFEPSYPYRDELEYFAACIEGGGDPAPGARNSLRNARMLDELFRRARPFQAVGSLSRRREAMT
jgi:predicted dehydrogenase